MTVPASKSKKDPSSEVLGQFGCSKCRYTPGGCISSQCNPQKFKRHFEQFPTRYEGKFIRHNAFQEIPEFARELKPEVEKVTGVVESMGVDG